jgi:hypothetical protein
MTFSSAFRERRSEDSNLSFAELEHNGSLWCLRSRLVKTLQFHVRHPMRAAAGQALWLDLGRYA